MKNVGQSIFVVFIIVALLAFLALMNYLFTANAYASKTSCTDALEEAHAKIDQLETELRLRKGELAVVRGQLRVCLKKKPDGDAEE